MPMRRREFLTGTAAVAVYAALPQEADAITQSQRTLLGGVNAQPPVGFAWVTYTDPQTGQQRLVTYTDPSTGAVRPVMASLN